MVARSRQQAFAHLPYFLMNTGEFAERREAVEGSLGVDKLLILCIFSCGVLSTRERDREHFHASRHETFWRASASLLSEERQ